MNENNTPLPLPLPFDANLVLSRVDGDWDLLREVIQIFFEDTPRLIEELRAAIAQRDAKALEHSAHTLKGSIGNFGARTVLETAFALEQMGRRGDFAQAGETCARLEQQLAQLTPLLVALAKQDAA